MTPLQTEHERPSVAAASTAAASESVALQQGLPAETAPVPAADARWAPVLLFCVTVLTSAFLLFQVQPVIGKCILPWFGSSPGVWATCMLFFQLVLLGGYAYAHFLVSRLTPKRQALLHALLLGLALLVLPITPDPSWKPTHAGAPAGRILLLLCASVGLPYLLLSATGPLLQGWFARLHPGRSPYRLYALSNAGSLLALLSYPFVFERILRLEEQTVLWSWGYAVFALLCGGCAWLLARSPAAAPVPPASSDQQAQAATRPTGGQIGLWLALSACGSGLLLATTNQMCLDVAVVPFLWVVPLCIYLLSFILCFDSSRWYVRPLFFALLPLVMINSVRLLFEGVHLGLLDQIIGYPAGLFVCCMCCHGELARLKPAPQHLTLFFLVVSIGGAVGGLLVAIAAPALLRGLYEFPILLVLCAALMTWISLRDPWLPLAGRWRRLGARVAAGLACVVLLGGAWLTFAPETWFEEGASTTARAMFVTWRKEMGWALLLGVGLLLLGSEGRRRQRGTPAAAWWLTGRGLLRRSVQGTVLLGLLLLVGTFVWVAREDERRNVALDRGFYGVLAIREYNAGHSDHAWGLKHGRIRHGVQIKRHPDWPTSYYGPRSGVGLALRFHPRRADPAHGFRVGVIGLGAGTIAAYANAEIDPARSSSGYVQSMRRPIGDYLRFYELNPLVLDWAEQKFSFLGDARRRGADVETWLGDARLVLERQLVEGEAQAFDVLAVDAFSSDAVPIHLLTREALDTYWRHLSPDGILALHVSNRFLDMKPVVHRLARELEREVVYVKNKDRDSREISSASWILMTNNTEFLEDERIRKDERDLPEPGPLWTDDFSSLFELIKPDD